MKQYILALCMLACVGCTATTSKLTAKDLAASDALTVVDARPESEKETKMFSAWASSKEFGVNRIGDKKMSPKPIRLLQHMAFEKYAASGRLPTITVRHLVIYQNVRTELRANAINQALGGLLGALAADASVRNDSAMHTITADERSFDSAEEYTRGNFNTWEKEQKGSALVIYIGTEIDGKKVFTRSVIPFVSRDGQKDGLEQVIKSHLAHYDTGTNATTASATSVGAAQPSSAGVATGMAAMAQGVASQLSCGPVRANGDSSFLASCGAYDMAIDCDGGRCRPTHTVKAESN